MIGLSVTLVLGRKYPYTTIHKSPKKKFNTVSEIDNEKYNLIEKDIVVKNDQEKVNELVEKIIPKNQNEQNPNQKISHEIEVKVKGYFESNPNEATKIFKTMLKNK
jgi:hypothetical protein